MFVVDSRWISDNGIGRFARELISNNKQAPFEIYSIEGHFGDIFKLLDPIYLKLRLSKGCFYVSPSYNCPVFNAGKSILTLHDLMHFKFAEYRSLKNVFYYDYLVKPVCKKSPLIFTVSEFTKQEIVKWAGISEDKIVVVYNGVDDKYHVNVEPYKADAPYVFYIGDKKPHKNIKRLIEAFSLSSISNTHILMMSGVEHHEAKSWASEFGVQDKVKFSGFIPEEQLPSYYKGAALLALPSLYEGFGLPIIEAMAVGTPVLTSNLTSMPEIAGDAALLIDPYDVQDIASGLDRLVRDNSMREMLIKKGVKRASFFNWDKSREIWNKSLLNVIGKKQ